jgi:hypothetical protein
MLGLSLVFIPRFLDFIGTHFTERVGVGNAARDHLDADIEVLPARMSVLRDYPSEIIDAPGLSW